MLAAAGMLSACGSPGLPPDSVTAQRLSALQPVDAILLGEQHDAPDHQRVHREVVAALASDGRLAALTLEMAEQGRSTEGLNAAASEDAVKAALAWSNEAWPWAAYGPAVMVAVRAGVPVLGGNLPRAKMRESMADTQLEARLPGPALEVQQQLIRTGHCGLLPDSQIIPMTRIQIARDLALARTVSASAVPGKTVVMLAGSGHVNRTLGVPLHLPPGLTSAAVLIGAESLPAASSAAADFSLGWPAAAAPPKDYCAEFKARKAS